MSITLTCLGETVTLPDPETTEQIEWGTSRVHRTSRGGTPIVFADPQWPTTERLSYSFRMVGTVARDSYFKFLDVYLGKQWTLVNHLGETWVGVVIDPNKDSATEYRKCGETLDIIFEGELQ